MTVRIYQPTKTAMQSGKAKTKRWVLEHAAVAGTIIGARLGEAQHMADNARLFQFALDAEDQARPAEAFAATTPLPGDCGDEYRKPPFLTASGDLLMTGATGTNVADLQIFLAV